MLPCVRVWGGIYAISVHLDVLEVLLCELEFLRLVLAHLVSRVAVAVGMVIVSRRPSASSSLYTWVRGVALVVVGEASIAAPLEAVRDT